MRTATPPPLAAAPKAGPFVGPGWGAGASRFGTPGACGARVAACGAALERGADTKLETAE
jgi:hypothetical protein